MRKTVTIFLFMNIKTHFGYSIKLSHRDGSFAYNQHMFSFRKTWFTKFPFPHCSWHPSLSVLFLTARLSISLSRSHRKPSRPKEGIKKIEMASAI